MQDLRNIVILTGAGISAESGIATFRDALTGLWERFDPAELACERGFRRDPALVWGWYRWRAAQVVRCAPNAGHLGIAALQDARDVTIVTQNVDDLHDRAHVDAPPAPGFDLIHMHGELLKGRCTRSGVVSDWPGDMAADEASPDHPEGRMRPHIVWFGEIPLHMDRIERALSACDLFVSIGTSGAVYPAAGFVEAAGRAGARTVEFNLEPTMGSHLFDEGVYGPAGQTLPAFLEAL